MSLLIAKYIALVVIGGWQFLHVPASWCSFYADPNPNPNPLYR